MKNNEKVLVSWSHADIYFDLLEREGKDIATSLSVLSFGNSKYTHSLRDFSVKDRAKLHFDDYNIPSVVLNTNFKYPFAVVICCFFFHVIETWYNISLRTRRDFSWISFIIPFPISFLIPLKFGHALHVIFSRTEFQHLSGIRGPQDYSEIFSTLMERYRIFMYVSNTVNTWYRFTFDRSVLRMFAKNTAGASIPESLVTRLLRRREFFAGRDVEDQVSLVFYHDIIPLWFFSCIFILFRPEFTQ